MPDLLDRKPFVVDHTTRVPWGTAWGYRSPVSPSPDTVRCLSPGIPISWELARNANSQPHLNLLNRKLWTWDGQSVTANPPGDSDAAPGSDTLLMEAGIWKMGRSSPKTITRSK